MWQKIGTLIHVLVRLYFLMQFQLYHMSLCNDFNSDNKVQDYIVVNTHIFTPNIIYYSMHVSTPKCQTYTFILCVSLCSTRLSLSKYVHSLCANCIVYKYEKLRDNVTLCVHLNFVVIDLTVYNGIFKGFTLCILLQNIEAILSRWAGGITAEDTSSAIRKVFCFSSLCCNSFT